MPANVELLSLAAVKGFGQIHPSSITIEASGPVGDRDFYPINQDGTLSSVVDRGGLLDWWSAFEPATGMLRIGKGAEVIHEDQVVCGEPVVTPFYGDRKEAGFVVQGAWAELLSDLSGERLRLVKAASPSGGEDLAPVSLISTSSTAAIGVEPDQRPIDHRRFRMNIAIAGPEAFGEDTWVGHDLTIGEARLRIEREVARCVIPQRRAGDDGTPVKVLRMIAQSKGPTTTESGRSLNLGVYASVVQPGRVTVGDSLRLIG